MQSKQIIREVLRTVDIKSLTITREVMCAGQISPFQYGQFVEYLCDLVPSMWAEKLYDNNFAGLLYYMFAHIKETDFQEKPWYPNGATNRAVHSMDSTTKISGEVSRKIEATGATSCTVGLSQDGLAVQAAHPCTFSCYLKQHGVSGPVTVTVTRKDGQELSRCVFTPDSEWEKYTARLEFAADSTYATLSISFRGPGTLWLDNVSLMPENAIAGWRPDVVEAVRAIKPGIIRFGGSALEVERMGDFEWRDTIGDPARRKPFYAWGGLQPTGPGLEEFVQFCQLVDAEPLICVRFSSRTARDAADEVEYFNGAVDTPMGARRAKNGHAEPYHVKYWQVGNDLTGEQYEAQLPVFCQAMKAVDPSVILLASWTISDACVREVGANINYVCTHHYGQDLSAMEDELIAIKKFIHKHAPKRPLKFGVTEWSSTANHMGPARTMLLTLENGMHCARYQNLLHRYCDVVEIANRSNLINSFGSGFLQVDRYQLYKTPAYYVTQLYIELAGTRPLRIAGSGDDDLDMSATLSADDKTVALFVVNSSLAPITRDVDFSAFAASGSSLRVWEVSDREGAGEPDVTNSFADPERIAAREGTFHAETPCVTYTFSPLSLTVLQWAMSGD